MEPGKHRRDSVAMAIDFLAELHGSAEEKSDVIDSTLSADRLSNFIRILRGDSNGTNAANVQTPDDGFRD